MNQIQSSGRRLLCPFTLFRIFKYIIYCFLAANIYLFFQVDYLASREVFGGFPGWSQISEAFAATIDTAAWVVLLLLFELETAVIPHERLKGTLEWILMAVRLISYSFIGWAFYGYLTKLGVLLDTFPLIIDDVCDLVGSGATWVADLNNYPALDQAACGSLQGQSLVQISNTHIIGTDNAVRAARNLSIVDIINAANWLLIVVLLEFEVYMQLKDRLTGRLLSIISFVKVALYSIVFICALYWGFLGDFLDFWDAFLWLVAFIFIEMNIFQWHVATEQERLSTV